MGVTTAADRAASSTPATGAGRWGLAARGVIYGLVALLALRVAFGGNATANGEGALHAIARQPFGRGVLAALAVGFLAHAAYRVLLAISGREEEARSTRNPVVVRLGDAAIAVLYVGLFASSLALVLGRGSAGDSEQKQAGWTARLLTHSWGEWVVALVGVGVIVAGVVLVVMGLRESFADKLRDEDLRPWQRTWFPRLGLFGYVARGAVIGLVGGFLVKAAVEHDPSESVGVDGALHKLADASFGPALLTAVAVGLAAFAAYSLVEARWRRVLER